MEAGPDLLSRRPPPAALSRALGAVVRAAVRHYRAGDAWIAMVEGDHLRAVAHEGRARPEVPVGGRVPLSRDSVAGAAVVARRVVHGRDVTRAPARRKGMAAAGRRAPRTTSIVAAPILLGGDAIGVIALRRRVPFAAAEVALLRAFAEHAAAAIESARRGDALTEARAQQEAVGEILRLVSRSPTDLEAVFEGILSRATRLAGADSGAVFEARGGELHLVASVAANPGWAPAAAAAFPTSLEGEAAWAARTLARGRVRFIEDAQLVPLEATRRLAQAQGFRSVLIVPMFRQAQGVGVINLGWAEVRPYPERIVPMLEAFADQAVIAIENARLFEDLQARNRDLTEALEQQTATAEILRVISSSPTDIQPVLDVIVRSAVRLCGGYYAVAFLSDGERLHVGATHNMPPAWYEVAEASYPAPLTGDVRSAQVVRERRVVHVLDMQEDPDVSEGSRRRARTSGYRTWIGVPMLGKTAGLGAIAVARQERKAFSDREIELLRVFADQAVIAIENVRLFTELEARNRDLSEALERQTATAEILRVISSSPTDTTPVFRAIIERATRLAGAHLGVLWRYEGGGVFRAAASSGAAAAFATDVQTPRRFERPFFRETGPWRATQIPDVRETEPYRRGDDFWHRTAEEGMRTLLIVPLVQEDRLIGSISIYRREVRPFTEPQVDLVRTFADQAVIAIENVRLFTELEARNRDLSEALERQTATAEILRVISSSPTDTAPVFRAIIERATRLAGAHLGVLWRYEGGGVFRAAASSGAAAAFATDVQTPRRFERPFFRETGPWHVAQIPDVRETEPYQRGDDFWRRTADEEGMRTLLIVPLIQEDRLIGSISIYRREVRPFTEAQVDLVRTFADQAVIAIENVRLFTELEARNRDLTVALDQQTATSEILKVISSSPREVQPAFAAIAESAARLTGAVQATLYECDGGLVHLRALSPLNHPHAEQFRGLFPRPLSPDFAAGRVILDRTILHVADLLTDPATPPTTRQWAEWLDIRGVLWVPLLRDGEAIGVIGVVRAEAGRFPDDQVKLLQTFADQAVIAIENVRLFRELDARNRDLTESLDRQTATAELLRVVSQSRLDVQPVFDAIAASARRLCRTAFAGVFTYDGAMVHLAALDNFNPQGAEEIRRAIPAPAGKAGARTRAISAGVRVMIPDVAQDPEYRLVTVAATTGFRSLLSVPMVRAGRPIGTITVARAEPGTFDDSQVELLETFADQAVIAIENARLLSELETRNLDLTESLERQTATAEILRVISEAHGDVQPVFEAIAESALRLLRGFSVAVVRVDGDRLELVASRGGAPGGEAAAREGLARLPRERGTYVMDAVLGRAVQHIADVEEETVDPGARAVARACGWRANIAVPMVQEGEVIGLIMVSRQTPGRFSSQQVELMKTFADQAVIAVRNASLLTDLQSRTYELTRSVEQLTALGEVGQAVSSSLDLETVLTTVVSRAVALTGVDDGVVFEYDEAAEEFTYRAATETGGAVAEARRQARIRKGEGVLGRTAVTGEPAQVTDITRQDAYDSRLRETLLDSGVRALLAVPMLREGRLLGGIVLSRNRPGEFPPATVDLLRTFATQSALAIQNARLYRELAEQGRQLEVASRHKTEFLASMSHELRTPLNGILGFNEMILGEIYGEVPPDLQEPLTEMQNSGRHLLRLINNVLDLSKIEAGRMELSLTEYAVADVVEQVRASLHALAADKGLEFVTAVSAGLPLVHGDAGRIAQCLTNLAGNAIKFTREGRVEITAELRDGLLVYRVSDTGIGIAPDQIATLFTDFRQADPTIASEFGGSGLGLSITRKFAEMHGGRVWVESEPGQGSSFFLAVPLRAGEGAPA